MGYLAHPTPAATLPASAEIDDWAYTDPTSWQPPPDPIHWAHSVTNNPGWPTHEPEDILNKTLDKPSVQQNKHLWQPALREQLIAPPPVRRLPDPDHQRKQRELRHFFALVDAGHTNEELAAYFKQDIAMVRHLAAGRRVATSDPPG